MCQINETQCTVCNHCMRSETIRCDLPEQDCEEKNYSFYTDVCNSCHDAERRLQEEEERMQREREEEREKAEADRH